MQRRNFLGAALAFCGLGWMIKPKLEVQLFKPKRVGLHEMKSTARFGKLVSECVPCGCMEIQTYEFKDGAFIPSGDLIMAENPTKEEILQGKQVLLWRCPQKASNGDKVTWGHCPKHKTDWQIVATEC